MVRRPLTLLCRDRLAQKISNSDHGPYLIYVHHIEIFAKLRKGMSRDTIGKKLVDGEMLCVMMIVEYFAVWQIVRLMKAKASEIVLNYSL